ncbi:toxin-antitoxin system YwqK family antitoxin [Chryseobacterium echinoideorum]|uniref:hypothetical protein n=1 Tax=Chryseobacterium echinoideorum TaxID=1549648 RepID=UPI00118706C3|nr:hypothetical protein [Chryseobacterium echinoideorum]
MLRIQKNDKDLKIPRLDGGGVPIFYYKEKPFTGIVFSKYDNGVVFKEEEYENGYQEGWIRYYFENGKLNQESNNHNNITIDDTFKEWDKDGNLISSF